MTTRICFHIVFFFLCCYILTTADVQVEKDEDEFAIGIDFGLTKTAVAVFRYNKISMILDDEGNKYIPSLVAFPVDHNNNKPMFGNDAKKQASSNPNNTFSDLKRFLGKNFTELEAQVGDVKTKWPFTIIDRDGWPVFVVTQHTPKDIPIHREFNATELCGMFLKHVKETAEAHLGKQVKYVVMAIDDEQQHAALVHAAKFADLKVERIVSEAHAAITGETMRYIHHPFRRYASDDDELTLVFKVGGTHSKISVLLDRGNQVEIVASSEDLYIGGRDWDKAIADYLASVILNRTGIDPREDVRVMQQLMIEAETAKERLSTLASCKIDIPGLGLTENLERESMELLGKPLFDEIEDQLNRVLEKVGRKMYKIKNIVMVGGSTKVPKLKAMIEKTFEDSKKYHIARNVNPDEIVARGLANIGGRLFPPNTNILYESQTSLSLGVGTADGLVATIIPHYSFIPSKRSKHFTNAMDNQTSVVVRIFEGDRILAQDCKLVVELELRDLIPFPMGVLDVVVTLELSPEGELLVEIVDLISRKSLKHVMAYDAEQPVSPLMLQKFYEMKEEDEKTKAKIIQLNREKGIPKNAL